MVVCAGNPSRPVRDRGKVSRISGAQTVRKFELTKSWSGANFFKQIILNKQKEAFLCLEF